MFVAQPMMTTTTEKPGFRVANPVVVPGPPAEWDPRVFIANYVRESPYGNTKRFVSSSFSFDLGITRFFGIQQRWMNTVKEDNPEGIDGSKRVGKHVAFSNTNYTNSNVVSKRKGIGSRKGIPLVAHVEMAPPISHRLLCLGILPVKAEGTKSLFQRWDVVASAFNECVKWNQSAKDTPDQLIAGICVFRLNSEHLPANDPFYQWIAEQLVHRNIPIHKSGLSKNASLQISLRPDAESIAMGNG